jgi:steroid 5-alpha reductase family enzyme
MFDKYHPGYFGKVCCGAGLWCTTVQKWTQLLVPPSAIAGAYRTVKTLTGVMTVPVLLQVGMRYFNKRTNKYHSPIVNLDKLWTLVGDEVRTHLIRTRSIICQ